MPTGLVYCEVDQDFEVGSRVGWYPDTPVSSVYLVRARCFS